MIHKFALHSEHFSEIYRVVRLQQSQQRPLRQRLQDRHQQKLIFSYSEHPVQKLPNLFPRSDPGPIRFSTCGRRGAHGVARVGTTSDYDRQDYFQIFCCGRDIVVTLLKLKCQNQKVNTWRVRKHRIVGEIYYILYHSKMNFLERKLLIM